MPATNALIVTGMLIEFLEQSARLSNLLNQVHLEGRDVNDEEMNELFSSAENHRIKLKDLLASQ